MNGSCLTLLLVLCCDVCRVLLPHRYVFSRGGPDRTLDLTYNKLYGEFPAFLVKQAADLPDSCLCTTNFTVSNGNQLYCPTKATLAGAESQLTPNLLDTFRQANYTCLLPNQKEPVRCMDERRSHWPISKNCKNLGNGWSCHLSPCVLLAASLPKQLG